MFKIISRRKGGGRTSSVASSVDGCGVLEENAELITNIVTEVHLNLVG